MFPSSVPLRSSWVPSLCGCSLAWHWLSCGDHTGGHRPARTVGATPRVAFLSLRARPGSVTGGGDCLLGDRPRKVLAPATRGPRLLSAHLLRPERRGRSGTRESSHCARGCCTSSHMLCALPPPPPPPGESIARLPGAPGPAALLGGAGRPAEGAGWGGGRRGCTVPGRGAGSGGPCHRYWPDASWGSF